jgi:hypothetical protein
LKHMPRAALPPGRGYARIVRTIVCRFRSRARHLQTVSCQTGFRPAGALLPLGDADQAGRKRVTAFAMAGDIEWPPNHGRLALFRGRPRGMVCARPRARRD